MRPYTVLFVGLFGLSLAPAAVAQPSAQQPSAPPPSQPTPPQTPNSPPEVIAPKSDATGKSSASVIAPPNVDPGMSVKPPANAAKSMIVVPPPGSPGGNPDVVPK
jgi:hypothetical protein